MSDILKSTATISTSKTRRPVITLQFLRDHPTALLSLQDLKQAMIVGSYQSAQRWVAAGKLAEPIRLPNGQLRWTAQDALDALGRATNSKKAGSWVVQRDANGADDEERVDEGEGKDGDEAEEDDDAQRISTSGGAI